MHVFDAAWSMLKALPEQQMDRVSEHDIGGDGQTIDPFFTRLLALPSLHHNDPELAGYTRPGTMHPAIQGLLARRGLPPNQSLGSPESASFRTEPVKQTGGYGTIGTTTHYDRGSVFNPTMSQREFSDMMHRNAREARGPYGEAYPFLNNPQHVGNAGLPYLEALRPTGGSFPDEVGY
jgi:hypothetical protein